MNDTTKEILINTVAFIVMAAALTGCNRTKIDASTDEKLENSIQAIKKPLSVAKKRELEDAIQKLKYYQTKGGFSTIVNSGRIQRELKDKLDGKTADEIILAGDCITNIEQAKRWLKRGENDAELKQLYQDAIKTAKKNLKGFSEYFD